MTTNQTIDGVPRAQLADIADRIEHNYPNTAKELRTLLEAPAVERKPFGWFRTPKDCPLQGMFLHYDPEHGERDIQNALDFGFTVKRLYESPATQPQGEPVAYQRKSKIEGSEWHYIHGCDVAEAISMGFEVRPLYAEQPAPVAVYEEFEFAKWMHEVVEVKNHVRGVSKIQRRDVMSLEYEKVAREAWQARARLNKAKE